jgi:opacity protein-like surface antigen
MVGVRLVLALALLMAPAAAAQAAVPEPNRFGSCGDLVRYARAEGAEGAKILRPQAVVPTPFAAPPSGGGGTGGGGQADLAAPVAGTDFSGTNVQEEGVDEPDSVKTDGQLLYVATHGAIRSVDVSGGAPRAVGTLNLDTYDSQLLLHGQKLIAISGGGRASSPASARSPS